MLRPCILVVHDEPALSRLIVGLLHHAGYEVAAVENGEEGVQALGRSRRWFDLVIVNAFTRICVAPRRRRAFTGTFPAARFSIWTSCPTDGSAPTGCSTRCGS